VTGKQISGAVVSRLKLIAGLDISEKRLPQDGRFNMEINQRAFDVRLSTLPVQHGESVVMRLLAQDDAMRSLDDLGMHPDIQQRFQQLIQRPHGVVLVTGPTGSGKTTTLYAGLNLLNTPERKIITVEDPVEYRIPRLNQVHINVKAGLTFAKVLRACLRQDPDVILVGEMRDQETAEIGLRAAMTGHLVLSTLHTNDAINTPSRLIDMGAEPFLVATALQAILAQRLIRKLCDSCKRPSELSPQQQIWLEGFNDPAISQAQYFYGKGCPECNQTGYRGRLPIHELLEIDKLLADLLKNGEHIAFAQAAHQQDGFKPLMHAALAHAMAGRSTIDEVLRIAGDVQEH
ncbi:MAG TPA: type II/IV secretion system protein, partial [Myxococcales bacterium]|nr:type II/IV secretion system protein [Myxococcales bacterium]